jgi:hypothetical protein
MNQKTIAVLVALLSATALYYGSVERKDDYSIWKQQFNVVYSAEEDAYRKIIFLKNLEIINRHNADKTQTYKMGLNQFSALHDAEFEAIYLNPKVRTSATSEETTINAIIGDVDWVA